MALTNGNPPEPSNPAHLGNWRQAPYCRWAFNHVREIVPAAPVSAKPGSVKQRSAPDRTLSDISFVNHIGERVTAAQWAETAQVDSVVALHRDNLVLDWYGPGQAQHLPHILMSVSKSVLGLVAGAVFAETDTSADMPIVSVLPELKNSAWSDATLRHALDMQIRIRFEEDYLATDGAIIAYRKAQGWNSLEAGESATDLRGFFPTLERASGQQGEQFHYVSPNTDMMAWALERIAGTRYSELLSTLLWQPMDAESDAYITVDRLGAPRAAGGLCTTPRDLARLGLLVAEGGATGSRQVLPADWVADTLGGGSLGAFASGDFHDKFPGLEVSYRNYCYWLNGAKPCLMGIGIHGQSLLIDTVDGWVLVVFSSHGDPQPDGAAANALALFDALRDA